MKRQQKILAAVVGLGVAAVVVDRAVVGYDATGPATASARSTASVSTPSATSVEVMQAAAGAPTVMEVTDARNPLAAQLSALESSQSFAVADLRDAFRTDADWLAKPQDLQAAGQPAEKLRMGAREFREKYRLDAVARGENSHAVLNGTALVIGQQLGETGIVLESVSERAARFRVNGELVDLQVKSASPEQLISSVKSRDQRPD